MTSVQAETAFSAADCPDADCTNDPQVLGALQAADTDADAAARAAGAVVAADDNPGDGEGEPDPEPVDPEPTEPVLPTIPSTPIEEIGRTEEPIATAPVAGDDSGAPQGPQEVVGGAGDPAAVGVTGGAAKNNNRNNGAAGANSNNASSLPKTGAPVGWLTIAAIGAMAAGAATIAVRRRVHS